MLGALLSDPRRSLGLPILSQLNIWAPLPIILAGGYKAEQAVAEAEKFTNAIIAFGRHFISNVSRARRRRSSLLSDALTSQPDLPLRIKNGVPFTPYNRKTFYTPEAAEGDLGFDLHAFRSLTSSLAGYTTYEAVAEAAPKL